MISTTMKESVNDNNKLWTGSWAQRFSWWRNRKKSVNWSLSKFVTQRNGEIRSLITPKQWREMRMAYHHYYLLISIKHSLRLVSLAPYRRRNKGLTKWSLLKCNQSRPNTLREWRSTRKTPKEILQGWKDWRTSKLIWLKLSRGRQNFSLRDNRDMSSQDMGTSDQPISRPLAGARLMPYPCHSRIQLQPSCIRPLTHHQQPICHSK